MTKGGTKISWCDETWNPVTGCSKVSEGCRNCYAAQLAPRLAAMGQTHAYTDLPWTKPNAAENVKLHPDRLEMPLRWKRPRRVFVNSMSDLFHELIPFEFVDRVFAVMALAPQHTFQVLTKRPERMAEYLSHEDRKLYVLDALCRMAVERQHTPPIKQVVGYLMRGDLVWASLTEKWPLPNVWLGTSVEDQRAADERIPHLLRTPATVRFLSCEPLIGPVDLMKEWDVPLHELADPNPGIHWVIAGGESGPGHRALDHAWMRSLRDQCADAGVPFWAKQDSGTRSEIELPEDLRIRHFPEAAGVGA